MTYIYLVRHCESVGNLNHSFAGHSDVDISERGALQLKCLEQRFKSIKLDVVYTSPLLRAYKTAKAINCYSNAKIVEEPDFIEINLGVLDGKPVSSMSKEQKDKWKNTPDSFFVEGGESMREVAERTYNALKRVAEQNLDGVIAIASHGCAIRNLMRVLKGMHPQDINNVAWCDNAGVNLIKYENGKFIIEYENDTTHLSADVKAEPVSNWK